MDLDALTAARREEWARLDELSRVALAHRRRGRRTRHPLPRRIGRSRRHQDVGRPHARTATTSRRCSRARGCGSPGGPENVLRQIPRFFALQLPAALYRVRWTTLVIAVGVRRRRRPSSRSGSRAIPRWSRRSAATRSCRTTPRTTFTGYYSENPAAVFAGTVWTNNAWIAAQCVLFGITGIWPIMVLVQNAVGVGTAAAVMIAYGRGDVFLLFILPHGQLELTCIFVAARGGTAHLLGVGGARAGARAARRSPRPDDRSPRSRSASSSRSGCRGSIEGFVTAQPWPWPVKIGIGAAALGAVPGLHARRRPPGAPARRDGRPHRVRGGDADPRRGLTPPRRVSFESTQNNG